MEDNKGGRNKDGDAAVAVMDRARPQTGQKTREIQPYGAIVKLSIVSLEALILVRLMTALSSSSFKDFKTKTRQRESKAEMISKLGFSVVAPMSVNFPLSTYGKRKSC